MKRIRLLTVLPGLLLAALAGCGTTVTGSPVSTPDTGGTPTAAPAPSIESEPSADAGPTLVNACELLTHAEAEALAGTALEAGREGNPDNPQCTYVGPPTGPVAQVELYVGDGAKKFYDIDVELGHEFTPVPGLGDEAFAEENAVFFRKAATWVGIQLVLLNDPAANHEPLVAAARTVAERL